MACSKIVSLCCGTSDPNELEPLALKQFPDELLRYKKFKFKHGSKYSLPDNKILIACYHPSPRNVNTKIITSRMINKLFRKAKKIAKI